VPIPQCTACVIACESPGKTLFYEHIVSLIYANLVDAQENGELKTEVDLRSLAGFIVSAWQGTQLRMKVTRDRKVLDEFLRVLNEAILT